MADSDGSKNPSVEEFCVDKFSVDGQYFYDEDLMLGEYAPKDLIDKVRNMDVEPSDIVVASYPKTGTTLLQEIIWLLRNNADSERAKLANFERVPFVDDVYFDGLNKFYQLEHPRHFKTHLPYRYLPKSVFEKNAKIVYVYRNPKDTLVSYYHFYRMILGLGFFPGSWNDFFDLFYRVNKGVLYYGSLLKHFREFLEKRDDPNLFVTCYETLVRHPHTEIKRMAEFVQVEYDDNLIDKVVDATTFTAMKNNPATNYEQISDGSKFDISPFMRKGQIGDWKNYFTSEQNSILDEMIEKELGDIGIDFIYD